MDIFVYAIPVGAGATAVMDLWSIVRKRLFVTALPNYGLVGRWLAHMPRGRFFHDSIAAAASVRGERMIGWAAHYLIGITFAAILLGIWGAAWLAHPGIGPALLVGIVSVAAPFFIMQPGMGGGIAASRAANPASARLQSFVTHAVSGLGCMRRGG